MDIQAISDIFEEKFQKCTSSWANKKGFKNCKDTINEISKDGSNLLCKYKNEFFSFDYIAKEYGATEESVDMIFFDIENNYIVLVEYKNGKIKDKKSIQAKFLNSFSLFSQILQINKQEFWSLRTYLVFVTNKDKNLGQANYINHQRGSLDMLNYLDDDIILYGFKKYKPWYFDEIKTPFCNEFAKLMEKEFNIKLEEQT